MNAARTILTRTSSVMVVLAFAALLLFAIGPHTGAYRTVSILSGSMNPSFSAGDAIITAPIPAIDVQAGDVITYHAPIAGRPVVTHRVIDVKRENDRPVVKTKGDANDAADPWEARLEDDIAWRQVAVIPHAGAVIASLRSERIRNALLYGAPSLLVALLLLSIWTPTRHRASEQWAERIDLNALVDAVQADLALSLDATCMECRSSVSAYAPCPFCDEVLPAGNRQLAAA